MSKTKGSIAWITAATSLAVLVTTLVLVGIAWGRVDERIIGVEGAIGVITEDFKAHLVVDRAEYKGLMGELRKHGVELGRIRGILETRLAWGEKEIGYEEVSFWSFGSRVGVGGGVSAEGGLSAKAGEEGR